MIRNLFLITVLIGACTAAVPIGPPVGKAFAANLNDAKFDEKPRLSKTGKSGPAPGNNPAPAGGELPPPTYPPTPLPRKAIYPVTQPSPPSAPVQNPATNLKLVSLFTAILKAQSALKAKQFTTTMAPVAPSSLFMQQMRFPTASSYMQPMGASPFSSYLGNGMQRMQYQTPYRNGIFGQSSGFGGAGASRHCLGECKSEMCDYPTERLNRFAYCGGTARKPKHCCAWAF